MENEIKKKLKVKMVWNLFILVLILQFLIEWFSGLRLLVFGLNANFIRLILGSFLLLAPIYFLNYTKHKLLKKICGVLSVICLIPIIFLYMFLFSGNKYFYFRTPYKSNSRILVAEETSWLLSGSTSFYERKYGIFIKPINQSITTDDGYRPFSNDEYKIKWLDEERMQLDYGYGSMNIWKTDIISFK